MLPSPDINPVARPAEMNLKCSICGKEEDSLLRDNHRDLGDIKLCVKCWSKEQSKNMLLPLDGQLLQVDSWKLKGNQM